MLGIKLRLLREERGKTQDEVSNILNIARGTYAHYELGKRSPDYDTLKKLADFFGVSTDYLLDRTEKRDSPKNGLDTKAYHNLDIDGLPEEAIKQVEDYIEFVKQKYNPDGSLKNK